MNLAEKLGYSREEKLLIIHADDAGLAHSQNRAIIQSLKSGLVNSYSIMVPCPWFYEMVVFARNYPQFDHGVHLTLTCEWENYKFGPVLPTSEVPTLVNADGHFYRTREELRENASLQEVARELEAQVEKALKFGLAPSHIDSHMYSVGATADFLDLYRDLGKKYDLPVLLNGQLLEMVGLSPGLINSEVDLVIDKVHLASFSYFERGELSDFYFNVFDTLASGLNVLLVHPAFDDDEMQGITINHPNFGSAWRQIDFDAMNNPDLRKKLEETEVQLVTWAEIRKVVNE